MEFFTKCVQVAAKELRRQITRHLIKQQKSTQSIEITFRILSRSEDVYTPSESTQIECDILSELVLTPDLATALQTFRNAVNRYAYERKHYGTQS